MAESPLSWRQILGLSIGRGLQGQSAIGDYEAIIGRQEEEQKKQQRADALKAIITSGQFQLDPSTMMQIAKEMPELLSDPEIAPYMQQSSAYPEANKLPDGFLGVDRRMAELRRYQDSLDPQSEDFGRANQELMDLGRERFRLEEDQSLKRLKAKADLAPNASAREPTERELKIAALTRRLRERGMPIEDARNEASDIVEGRVRLTSPDKFDNIYRINLATGERELVTPEQAAPVLENAPEAFQPTGAPSLEQAAEEGTGPWSAIQAGIGAAVGPFIRGELFPDNERSRQQLRQFNQVVKTALVNNPRFPVAEQQTVQNLLPDTTRFFADPDSARENLKELRRFLEQRREVKRNLMENGFITRDRKAELADQADAIDEVLQLMGPPADASSITEKDIDSMGEAELDKLLEALKDER